MTIPFISILVQICSDLYLACWRRWAGLAPQDLLHERAELRVGYAAWRRSLHLREHGLNLLVSQVLAFSAEALFQVLLCDISRVLNIEVVEGKRQVGLCDCLPAVDGDCEELGVVDLAVVIEVDSFEYLIDFLFAHVQLVKGLSDLAELQSARVVLVECAEGVSKEFEVELAGVGLGDKEGERLDLKSLV